MPASGVASPSTLPGRCERSTADASVTRLGSRPVARRSTTAAAPSFGEHSMKRCSGSHTSREPSTSSAVTSLRNIAFGLCDAVAPVLHHDPGQVVLREARLAQQALGPEREVRGRGREPGLLAPRLEEARPDDALRHLLHAEHEHAVVLAGPDRARRELQRRRTARAAGLDVDDRDAGERERAEHLVARGDARVRGAAERGLEVARARRRPRRARRAPRRRPCR